MKTIINNNMLCVLLGMTALVVGLFCVFGTGAQAAPKGEVNYAVHTGGWEMRVAFDPHSSIGASSTSLTTLVFDGLVTKDSKGAFQPALAETWEIADDWSQMDFYLRKGVTFHNGDPVSARDVKFSIERAMREDLRFIFGPELRRSVDSVEIIDDHHVRINLKAPYPAFFDRATEGLVVVPKDYIEKVGDDGFAAKPIGAGPFKVVEFTRDVIFKVEAVENHYRSTPYIKNFTHKCVTEHSTRLAMLQRGEADLIAIPASYIPRVKRDPNYKLFFNKHTYVMTLVFFDLAYPEDSPFKDPRVRQATSYAIDREGIAKALGHGAWEPWGSFLAPYYPGFDPERNKPTSYDPDKARKLLAEAGYADGFDTKLISPHVTKAVFEPIQQQLAEVGIRARLEIPEFATWAASFTSGTFRGIGFGSGPWWVGRSHPHVALESHTIGTWSHNLATPEVEAAMEKLLHAHNQETMAKQAREVDEILLEQSVRLPLFSIHEPFAAGPRIKDFPGVPGVLFPIGFEFLQIKD
jgi:peptide/nickel transport system substrate-binding protein